MRKLNVLLGVLFVLVGFAAQARVNLSERDAETGYRQYLTYCGGSVEARCGYNDNQCRIIFRDVRECRGVKLYVGDSFNTINNTFNTSLNGGRSYYNGDFYVDYSRIGGQSSRNYYVNIYLYDTSGRSYEEIRVDLPRGVDRDNRGYLLGGNRYNNGTYYNGPYNDGRYDRTCDRYNRDYPYCR